MKKKSKSKNALMGKLMKSILDFLIRSGMSSEEVQQMFVECLTQFERRPGGARGAAQESVFVGNGNVSAEVIRIWHRDGRFLDRDARPKPLRLTRGPASLGALVKKLDPSADHMQSIQAMRAVGLIRKLPDGRYIPTSNSVTIDHLHPLAIEHVAKSVVRLVSTVCRNTDPGKRAMPLVERYAYVPDLSESEATAFADFTRSLGMAYLEAVDDWLERRRARRLPQAAGKAERKGIAAGVHLFAYLGDMEEASANAKLWRNGLKEIIGSNSASPPVEFRRASTPSRAVRA